MLQKSVVVSKIFDIQNLIRQVSREIFVADSLNEAIDITERISPDLVSFDTSVSPQEIYKFHNLLKENSFKIPTIFVFSTENNSDLNSTRYNSIDKCHYLTLDSDCSRIKDIIKSLSSEKTGDSEFFIDSLASSVNMVGKSKAIQEKIRLIKILAESECNPILVVGETGTGKELAAKAIHNLRHPKEPFVAINCAALTANLLESELFGHVKGAFTSADREKTGLLELANGGTLFMDEISEMPLDLQAKLLRVLQEKNFRKVGGTATIECKATIIASSNRNLLKEVKSKKFRSDLYYRLNICPITIAPLRSPNRKGDIRLLAEYFLKTSTICSAKSSKITCLTKMAMELLEKHEWPGNIRELKNIIERAILLETSDKIGLSSIIIDPIDDSFSETPITSENFARDFSLEKAERELIARALKETGWQKSQAASLLGITRATLYAKVKQYNIEKDSGFSNIEENDAEIEVSSLVNM